MSTKKMIIILIFSIASLLLLGYMYYSQKITYEDVIEKMSSTKEIIVNKESDKPHNTKKISNQKAIDQILKILSQATPIDEEWQVIPEDLYQLTFIDTNQKDLATVSVSVDYNNQGKIYQGKIIWKKKEYNVKIGKVDKLQQWLNKITY